MAASKTGKTSNKASGKKLGATRDPKTRVAKSSAGKSAGKLSGGKGGPAKEQKKTKRTETGKKPGKQRRHYTEKELGVPQLNMVTPVGVAKPPRGRKKGKVFVDDARSMMAIMAVVNAEKEGQIESKMLRARQLEEIHQLKRQEQEEREAARKGRLEEAKDSLRKRRLRKGKDVGSGGAANTTETSNSSTKAGKAKGGKKKVSFG